SGRISLARRLSRIFRSGYVRRTSHATAGAGNARARRSRHAGPRSERPRGGPRMKLEGCLVAITTPFRPDDILDESALARHAEWMVAEGVRGVVVCGTTGESATLTEDEKIRAMNVVSEAVGARAT